MFQLIPNETVPASVYRHLLPHESQVITVRSHPAIITAPAVTAVGGLIVAIFVTQSGASTDALGITWFTWLLVLGYAVVRMYRWLEEYFVVTNERFLLVTGVLTRDVSMIPMNQIADLRFRRSALGRLLGYGAFLIEDSGSDPAFRFVNFLPYPEQLYLEVCGLVFPGRREEYGGEK